jgi:hypothetical protein
MMGLYRLIYCSRTRGLARTDLEAILASCERNNSAESVTGMLLFDSDHFLQLLEGGRRAVSACYNRISNDPRHFDVEIVSCGSADVRLFERWSMRYVAGDGAMGINLSRYSLFGAFNPYEMAGASLEQLCVHVSLQLHGSAQDWSSSTASAG